MQKEIINLPDTYESNKWMKRPVCVTEEFLHS